VIDRSTLSSLEKEGFGRLLDQVNSRFVRGNSCNCRSDITWLNSSIECVFGFREVVS
jgi:hypothetical protein